MNKEIVEEIKALSTLKNFPDGSSYRSISAENIMHLSKTFETHSREIEIAALKRDIVPERYARNLKSFSLEDQATLLNARVSIVGLGGLGGAVTEILARTGIGCLHLIDGDTFEENNLNRQLFSEHLLLGKPKAEAAKKRVHEINASIVVQEHHEYLEKKNAHRLLGNSNVIVDCLDNVKTRFVLENASKALQRPLVSAAVAGASGHVITVFPEDRGLCLIYGDKELAEATGVEASLGSLPQAVVLIASIECSEVIKLLLNAGSVLRNRLLVVDLMDNTFEVMRLDS